MLDIEKQREYLGSLASQRNQFAAQLLWQLSTEESGDLDAGEPS